MENKDYTKDLSEIRELMSRSSQFISLSGLSGILAGVYALAGAFVAKMFIFKDYSNYGNTAEVSSSINMTILALGIVLILSISTALIYSRNKAKANNEQIWGDTSKRMLINFLIPFITGGIFILFLLYNLQYDLLSSSMLIFYGLALVNASHYTVGTIKYLGIAEIITGLVCLAFPVWGFWFWVIGFGFLHIIYGSLLYSQEKRQRA